MLRKRKEIIRGEIDPPRHTGEVVDKHGERRRIRDGAEVVQQGVVGDHALVVAWREEDRVVAAGLCGVLAETDCLAGGRRAAAHDHGDGGEARGVEGAARVLGYELALFAVQVDGFAVAALGDDAGYAGLGEVDSVGFDGGEVEVFIGLVEGDGGDVDAGDERSRHVGWCISKSCSVN